MLKLLWKIIVKECWSFGKHRNVGAELSGAIMKQQIGTSRPYHELSITRNQLQNKTNNKKKKKNKTKNKMLTNFETLFFLCSSHCDNPLMFDNTDNWKHSINFLWAFAIILFLNALLVSYLSCKHCHNAVNIDVHQ
jgi:hypothetical protein